MKNSKVVAVIMLIVFVFLSSACSTENVEYYKKLSQDYKFERDAYGEAYEKKCVQYDDLMKIYEETVLYYAQGEDERAKQLENEMGMYHQPTPNKTHDYQYAANGTSIWIDKVEENGVTYFVADVRLEDVSKIGSGVYLDENGKRKNATVTDTAIQNNAILAVNTDFYTYRDDGIIIRNGEAVLNKPNGRDTLCLFYDGSMEVFRPDEWTMDDMLVMGVKDSWSFHPMLVEDYKALGDDMTYSPIRRSKHPRTGIGYYEQGHYLIIVVDGRKEGYSDGVTLDEFADIFVKYGCQMAYNLDGGGSSAISFMGELVNLPQGGTAERPVDGILMIGE